MKMGKVPRRGGWGQIELLAPAKNIACGIAAINCGADAVYIGAEKFGARVKAGNSLSDIEKLIEYAHMFYVKVYVAINTILNDDEIPLAVKLVHDLYRLGADAIIIQDMGLLECDLPPIKLIASTQTANRTPEKVLFLEKVGFKRVILERALSLEEIKKIRENTTVELELFVHGAICVGYSGNCYLSYAIGGRSANRGNCAQPCRKLYSLKDAKGKVIVTDQHLICLKDLNYADKLKELIDAGITSFKIEGRLKDFDYVKNVVSYYRKKLDEIISRKKNLQKSSSGNIISQIEPDLQKTFNRGYTDYFLKSRQKNLASLATPKFVGEYLGIVSKVYKGWFELDAAVKLNNGDGICFYTVDGQLDGLQVKKFENDRIYLGNKDIAGHIPLLGTKIYRNLDVAFLNTLEKTMSSRKISIEMRLELRQGSLQLELIDEDGVSVKSSTEGKFEVATKPEVVEEQITKTLQKLGETMFVCQQVEICVGEAFIPISIVNNLRRKAVELLIYERLKRYRVSESLLKKNDYPYPEKELDFNANIFNQKAKEFYQHHGVKAIEMAAEKEAKMNKDDCLMTTKYCTLFELGKCLKQNKQDFVEPLYLSNDKDNLRLKFNCQKCEMEIFRS